MTITSLALIFFWFGFYTQMVLSNMHNPHHEFVRSNHHDRSVPIFMPMSLFNESETGADVRDWKTGGGLYYSAELAALPNSTYNDIRRAQEGEDLYAYENWFFGMKRGTIMESGALNGVEFSTSMLFETFADWRTIHVEANSHSFAQLRTNRPNSINIHAALCNETRTVHFVPSKINPAVSGILEFMNPSFVEMWHNEIFQGLQSKNMTVDDLPTIQCLKLSSLLHMLHLTHIDLWVLDVEGSEHSVLASFDFNKVHINTLIVECQNGEEDVKATSDVLKSHGIDCQLIDRNCFCVNSKYKPSKRPGI